MNKLKEYEIYLLEREFSMNTVQKYVRDVKKYLKYTGTEEPDRMMTLQYKEYLLDHYQLSSVNSMLAAVNSYLKYIKRSECCVRSCRLQRQNKLFLNSGHNSYYVIIYLKNNANI